MGSRITVTRLSFGLKIVEHPGDAPLIVEVMTIPPDFRREVPVMGCTTALLDDIRPQLAPDELAIKEARERRDAVRSFHGTLRTFNSGSSAHGTANCPVHLRDGVFGDARRSWFPGGHPMGGSGEGRGQVGNP